MRILLFLLLFPFLLNAQQLSGQTTISLLTCGQGAELYSTFGHSALRVKDPASGIDIVYNYGTFDFDTPDFYMKFTRGKLNYYLSVDEFDQFMYAYYYEKRFVFEQVLNLNDKQVQDLVIALEINSQTENRDYKYDFFYDNCSTRIRDILKATLGENLIYDTKRVHPEESFRDLIDKYLTNHAWSDFGIDLALGAPTDKIADPLERMFLPDGLSAGFADAIINSADGNKPLVEKEKWIYQPEINPVVKSSVTPATVFWALFILVGLISIFGRKYSFRWFDFFFYALMSVLCLFLLFLWFGTDHIATKWNYNLMWASPIWFFAFVYLRFKKVKHQKFYFYTALFMGAIMVFWILIPQDLHSAVVPIILTLGIRSWSVHKAEFKTDLERKKLI